ncbi:MAG: MgtC/SapB family protein [Acidobacteriota bacterium]
MPLHLAWEQIALRLALASVASFIIGLNRDEHGHPAGIRTTMLVCLAATFAMLQVNLLLPLAGKLPSSFIVMDLMRLPLGILSGIGFIGAGVIIKRDKHVNGVTTAATIWFVTVLGLLYGGGNLYLGIAASVMATGILWALKWVERYMTREYRGTLHVAYFPEFGKEAELRQQLVSAGYNIVHWTAMYDPPDTLAAIDCEVKWRAAASRMASTPTGLKKFGGSAGCSG